MASVHGERVKQYIKPTDSEYVKLAKQGGDKDLLVCHEVAKSDAAQPYAKCEWFDHIHNDEEDARNRRTSNQVENQKAQSAKDQQEVANARLEGSKIKEKYTRGGIPFHTDESPNAAAKNAKSAPNNGQENPVNPRLEGNRIKEKYTGGGVPFHTDNMSVWERKKVVPETQKPWVNRKARNPIH